tara:strand:- start:387 stop:524 length:138 start_codon:yes stop_codon:yes gene_type:complete
MVIVDEWKEEEPNTEIKESESGKTCDDYTLNGFGRVALSGWHVSL